VDSDQGGGPQYDWFDISGVGSQIFVTDEQMGPVQLLGFNISYYGNVYASIRVCSNGYLALTSNTVVATNAPIPNAAAPNNMIAPFWDDLNPGVGGGKVYGYQDVANDRYIVQWDAVQRKATGAPQTFQAIINDDGTIVFQYETVSQVDECTVGIENNVGNDGLEIAFNEPYLHDGLAILITDEPLPEWLSVAPTSGTVGPSSSTNLVVTFDSTDLLDGTYLKTIRLTTNDTDEPIVDVLAELTVTSGPTSIALTTLPETFQLAAARPNPFASQSTIQYAVPSPGADVRIDVFDVGGRRVQTLVNGPVAPGRHTVSWNGRDAAGKRTAAGVYFARMEAPGFSQVRKVTFLR
jgi:hypothetical protein